MERARLASSRCSRRSASGPLSGGGAATGVAIGVVSAAVGIRGIDEMRGGELGRSPGIGFALGVPGRGGASGNELRRLGGCDEKEGGAGGRLSGPASPPAGALGRAGAEGVFGSGVASTFVGAGVTGELGAPERSAVGRISLVVGFRLGGGGGGVCELRAVPASMSSIKASGSTSDSSLGSCIICATTLVSPRPRHGAALAPSREYHNTQARGPPTAS
jgi:hypothetical protein